MAQLTLTSKKHIARAIYENACLRVFVTFRVIGSNDVIYCRYMAEGELLEKTTEILDALDISYQSGYDTANKA